MAFRMYGTRFDPKYQVPTVKHGGGSVLVWGCFHAGGVGPLFRVEGIMCKEEYRDILANVMLPYGWSHMGRGWIFQQDNDPKHASKLVKQWFVDRRLKVLDWPSQSPDLKPIEHLWEELERRVQGKMAKNAAEKFEQLQKEWDAIPVSVLQNLIYSMPRWCQAVIDAKGFATKY